MNEIAHSAPAQDVARQPRAADFQVNQSSFIQSPHDHDNAELAAKYCSPGHQVMKLLYKQPNVQPTIEDAQVQAPTLTTENVQVLVPADYQVDQTSFIHNSPGQDNAQALAVDYCAQDHQVLKLQRNDKAQITMVPVDLPDPELHWKQRSQGLSALPYQWPHASVSQMVRKPSSRPEWLSAPHIYRKRVYF